MKKPIMIIVILSFLFTFSGCGLGETNFQKPSNSGLENGTSTSKREAIPFEADQLYAVAYLGYQTMDGLDHYVDQYLDSDQLPLYRVSDGDYYLVIPRYDDMSVSLFVNDMMTSSQALQFQNPNCGPFIVQCNVSDIFADITVRLEYAEETVEFSPFISLKDGELMIGDRGLDLAKVGAAAQADPYVGEYMDEVMDEPSLVISPREDGKYAVQISIFRLISIDDGVGEKAGEGISFTATDASGAPISGVITLEGETATVTFTDSTWEYLPNGTAFQYTKFYDTIRPQN